MLEEGFPVVGMGTRAVDLHTRIDWGRFPMHFKRAETNIRQFFLTLVSEFEGHEFPFCALAQECGSLSYGTAGPMRVNGGSYQATTMYDDERILCLCSHPEACLQNGANELAADVNSAIIR